MRHSSPDRQRCRHQRGSPGAELQSPPGGSQQPEGPARAPLTQPTQGRLLRLKQGRERAAVPDRSKRKSCQGSHCMKGSEASCPALPSRKVHWLTYNLSQRTLASIPNDHAQVSSSDGRTSGDKRSRSAGSPGSHCSFKSHCELLETGSCSWLHPQLVFLVFGDY